MPTKLRNMKAKSTAKASKKKKDAEASEHVDNEADSCKENNAVVVVVEKTEPVVDKKKRSSGTKTSRANSVVSLSQPQQDEKAETVLKQEPATELTEISSNNKKTKSRSKLVTSASAVSVKATENGTTEEGESKTVIDTVASSVASMSTTTIEAVGLPQSVAKKTASKTSPATKATKTTMRKMASGSVGGSSGSCSESSNSGASTTSSTNDIKEKKTKKKLKSLDTSSFSDSFTKFFVNKKITDYFQVRKSTRKCKSDIEKEKRQHIEDAILNMKEEGLEVRDVDQKGRGIFATRAFKRGEFVCEYAGEMVSYQEAKMREERYAKDETVGCYMYFFEYKSKSYCIDATPESNRLGRLLNHSKLEGNCQTKLFEIDSKPYLILVAARDIKCGEELTYDYGDRNKGAIESHPWLAQ